MPSQNDELVEAFIRQTLVRQLLAEPIARYADALRREDGHDLTEALTDVREATHAAKLHMGALAPLPSPVQPPAFEKVSGPVQPPAFEKVSGGRPAAERKAVNPRDQPGYVSNDPMHPES